MSTLIPNRWTGVSTLARAASVGFARPFGLARVFLPGGVPGVSQEQRQTNVFVDCIFMTHTRLGTAARELLQKGLAAHREQAFPDEWKLHHQGGPNGYQRTDCRVRPGTPEINQQNQEFTWNPTITGTKSEDTTLATSNGLEMIARLALSPMISIEAAGVHFMRPAIEATAQAPFARL